jgi:hypothetical protein
MRIFFFLIVGVVSCSAMRPVDVCVDLPKTSVSPDAGSVADANAAKLADAKGD